MPLKSFTYLLPHNNWHCAFCFRPVPDPHWIETVRVDNSYRTFHYCNNMCNVAHRVFDRSAPKETPTVANKGNTPDLPDSDAPTPDTTYVKFDSGAVRSAVMPFYSEIPYESLRRVALRSTGAPKGTTLTDYSRSGFSYAGGSRGYGYGNWKRGLPMEDTLNHAIQHLLQWKNSIEAGLPPNDDDLAAVAWAVLMPLMTFEEQYRMQYERRNEMLESYKDDMVGLDGAMRSEFVPYLLQPLAPEEPK